MGVTDRLPQLPSLSSHPQWNCTRVPPISTLEFFSTLSISPLYDSSASRLMTFLPSKMLSSSRFFPCHSLKHWMSCTPNFLAVYVSLRPEGNPRPPGLIKVLPPSPVIFAQLMVAVLPALPLLFSAAGLVAKFPLTWQFSILNVTPSPGRPHMSKALQAEAFLASLLAILSNWFSLPLRSLSLTPPTLGWLSTSHLSLLKVVSLKSTLRNRRTLAVHRLHNFPAYYCHSFSSPPLNLALSFTKCISPCSPNASSYTN